MPWHAHDRHQDRRPPIAVAQVTVIAGSLTWADIDAAAYAQGPDAGRWLRTRSGRTALVAWTDHSTTVIG